MTCIFWKTGYIIVLVYGINNIFGRYKVSNVCEICGKKKAQGATIIRRGLAKKKGGIGMHVVKVSPRTFEPNIQDIRVVEDGRVVRRKVCVQCIRSGKARVRVLETQDKWFGVTYKEDKPTVVAAIRKLIDEGVYPEKLFG